MGTIERRTFLLTALAATPLASCTTGSSLDRRRGGASFVGAGQDRTGHPRNLFGGLRLDTKVSSEETTGDLYIIQHTDEAKGGPPRHVHHAQDEWFYVLEGEYRIVIGEEEFALRPGDSILAPRSIPHVWAHVSEGEGRLIIAFQPAGEMESFLGALAEMGSTPTPKAMAPLFASHGMTMLGPPLPLT